MSWLYILSKTLWTRAGYHLCRQIWKVVAVFLSHVPRITLWLSDEQEPGCLLSADSASFHLLPLASYSSSSCFPDSGSNSYWMLCLAYHKISVSRQDSPQGFLQSTSSLLTSARKRPGMQLTRVAWLQFKPNSRRQSFPSALSLKWEWTWGWLGNVFLQSPLYSPPPRGSYQLQESNYNSCSI